MFIIFMFLLYFDKSVTLVNMRDFLLLNLLLLLLKVTSIAFIELRTTETNKLNRTALICTSVRIEYVELLFFK